MFDRNLVGSVASRVLPKGARALVAAAMLAGGSLAAEAQPIADPSGAGASVIVNSTDNVIATYLGTTAAFTDLLYFIDPISGQETFLFNNQTSAVGSTVDLGSFAVGTELIFRLASPQGDFFTGSPSRNPDGSAHAAVENNFGQIGTTLVSFEDLLGGPFDFNDLSFSFSGTVASTVPETGTWAMLIAGFGVIGVAIRRRRDRVTLLRIA